MDYSFDAVYESTFPILARIVFRITGREDVTEEICQEAFVRFFQRKDRFPDHLQARYWLIRVAKNLAINHARRRGREQLAVRKLGQQPQPRSADGAQELSRSESMQEIRDALLQLPETYREVIIMKEYGQLSCRDIAKVLGISESNVKVRAFRARERLSELLQKTGVFDVS